MKKLPAFYADYTDQVFKDETELQAFYRAGKTLKYDYVIVKGILFTMHEFDVDGQTLTYANKKHNKQIEVNTGNRYRDGFKDANVYWFDEPWYMRNDITYAE